MHNRRVTCARAEFSMVSAVEPRSGFDVQPCKKISKCHNATKHRITALQFYEKFKEMKKVLFGAAISARLVR